MCDSRQPLNGADSEPRLTANEIITEWRKGRISAHLRDVMLRAEGYKLEKDEKVAD